MAEIKTVCVFCGSRSGENPLWANVTKQTGRLLAEEDIRLVYGGGRLGLMGLLADAAVEAGGEVIGVIPDFLKELEVMHEGVAELIVVRSMHQRKNTMLDLSDAFVILPGGIGTMDEMFEILSLRQLGLHDKPIVIVDPDGYWTPLIDFIDHMITKGFVGADAPSLFSIVKSPGDIVDALQEAPEPRVEIATGRL